MAEEVRKLTDGCGVDSAVDIVAFKETLELVRRGIVKPVLLQTFPLEEANEAHRLIDEMKLTGRTALIVSS